MYNIKKLNYITVTAYFSGDALNDPKQNLFMY